MGEFAEYRTRVASVFNLELLSLLVIRFTSLAFIIIYGGHKTIIIKEFS
jgi:hypothetical protein